MRWSLIGSGLVFLLIGAYFDNSRGPLMPLLNQVLDFNYGQSSWLLVGGYLAALIFMLVLIPLSKKVSDKNLAIGICFIGIASSLTAPLVTGWWSLLILAALMGCVISGCAVLCNVLVISGTTTEYRARFLCGLHMMYGVGSFIAPLVVGYVAAKELDWSLALLGVLPFCLCLALYVMWKVPREEKKEEDLEPSVRLTPVQILILIIFSLYVAGEVTVSMWMIPYLVEYQGLDVASSAPYASLFFIVIAASRGLCFLSLKPKHESLVLWGCLVLACVFFLLGRWGWLWGFPLAGVMGPYFPLFIARVSRQFPDNIRSIVFWLITGIQISLSICHLFLGRLTDSLGIELTYWIPFTILLIALGMTLLYLYGKGKYLKKHRAQIEVLS